MSNFYLQGDTGGPLCPSLVAPQAGGDLLRHQGDAWCLRHSDVTPWCLATNRLSQTLPLRGGGDLISCVC